MKNQPPDDTTDQYRGVHLETAPEFLDTELKRFSRGSIAPHRLADLLVKVRRTTGEVELLYCHVEVQSHSTSLPLLRIPICGCSVSAAPAIGGMIGFVLN